MAAKAILVLCAQALLIQSTFSQCTSRAVVDASGQGPYGWAGPSNLAYDGLAGSGALAYNGLAAGAGRGIAANGVYSPAMEFTATSGGALPVTSSSAIAPTGISVVSENVYEGALSVAGEMPFVGTTGMEGAMPSAGAGAVNHACGDGITAMVSDVSIAPGAAITPAAAIAPAGLGLGAGFGSGVGFGSGAGFGAGFGSAAGFGPAAGVRPGAGFGAAGFGPSNRLGLGGCGRY